MRTLTLDASPYIAPGGVYEWGHEKEDDGTGNMVALTAKQQIWRQEWASFAYGCHQAEGWFLKNRTDFPKTSTIYSSAAGYIPGQFVISKTSILSKPLAQMPKRFPYPYNETSRNNSAPQQVVPIYVPVWWGK
ncbi:hypothetical protein ACQ86N_36445 [Puia sp. P3]|uniref:hypothetical protein n=1 Tax=Puia sp. P3 TaxID=3423952 RepID=UPI003D67A75F